MQQKIVLHYVYLMTIFIALILPGYFEAITAIIGMKRITIAFSSMDTTAFINSDATLYILNYIAIAVFETIVFIFCIYHSSHRLAAQLTSKTNKRVLTAAFPILATVGLLKLNAYLFPHSSHVYHDLHELSIIHPTSLIVLLALGLTFLIPAITIALKIVPYFSKKNVSISFILIGIMVLAINLPDSSAKNLETLDKKNVIIIGIDSFRIDHMHDNMPFLKKLLAESQVLSNSYTPFSRTFPAWSTILSGQFPPNSGARYNLIDEQLLNKNTRYLPAILQEQGYNTLYASDERRFSQIGKFHGFEHIIGPRTGLSDFIIGQYADFPLTNLTTLLNSSSAILPELTLNRAASHLYNPMAFTESLNNYISTRNLDKPLFMSVHHCMPHWPYHHGREIDLSDKNDEAETGYHLSLNAVDQQIKSLWNTLESLNMIDNSIIIFLSDHGESWNERLNFTLPNNNITSLYTNKHGSNVISNNEHRVLLALHGKTTQIKSTDSTHTLADVTPTILDLLSIDSNRTDGSSFYDPKKDHDKIFPVESGFTIAALSHSDIDPEQAVTQGLSRYRVKPDGNMRIKINEIPFLNKGKRIGVRTSTHLLTYQQPIDKTEKVLYLLNLNTMKSKEIKSKKDLKSDLENKLAKSLCSWYPEYITTQFLCET
jgi:hypothetical protein